MALLRRPRAPPPPRRWGDADLRRASTVTVERLFHLHTILKWSNYREGEQIRGCQGQA